MVTIEYGVLRDDGKNMKDNYLLQNLNPKQKAAFFTLVVVLLIAIVVGIIYAIRSSIYSVSVEIAVAPSDATIMVGDKQYQNGSVKLEPGTYQISIERDGFESYADEQTFESGKSYKIYQCLTETDSNGTYYGDNADDDDICFKVQEYELSRAEAELYSDKIYEVTPYHSYDKGFNIDPYKNDDGSITIKITTLSCNAERREALYQNALEYLTDNGINPNDYAGVEHLNGCE